MKRLSCFGLLTFGLINFQLFAQTETRYTVAFPNAVHHEAEITAEFMGVPAEVLKVRIARSSPGRYALHEFGKNIYAVKAENSKGEKLQISRPNPHQWDVSGHDGTVKITYTLFADHADGTYAGIDETHAHLNSPATFMYAPTFEAKPTLINFIPPTGRNWKVATQLKQETSPNSFSAPNLQYLMDSPAELSDAMWKEWQVSENGKTKNIRFALHHPGSQTEFEDYVSKTKKIVSEAQSVFGELPDFDFGTYSFIGCYMPHASRDGMEHRNSTVVTNPKPLKTNAIENLSTVSHEFFHAWNVERIRPQSLEPFNFEEANMSGELWFAEGFTSYYGDLLMVRSGAISEAEYAKILGATLNSFLQQPGKDHYSPIEMSIQATFVDAARSVDNVNRQNTYVSYYTYGEVIGLALDLSIRSKFPGLSLDDYMRAVWQKFGKPEKPYQIPNLEQTLAEVTKDEPFASEFFQKYIYGHAPLDFKNLLREAGYDLRLSKPKTASLGFAPLTFTKSKATMQAGSLIGSPLYKAGVENQDVLLMLDNKKIKSEKDLQAILKKYKPGDVVPVVFEQRSQKKETKLTFIENPNLELVKQESTQTPETEKTKQFRQSWLGSKRKT